MLKKSRKMRKRKSKRKFFLITIMLFLALSSVFIFKDILPFFSNEVIADGLDQKTDDGLNNDLSSNEDDENVTVEQNKQLTDNPNDILIVVNKKRDIPSDYKPSDLVIPNVRFSFNGEHEKKYMRQEAADALEELFNQADKEGIYLFAISGYRSYATQERIFNNYVKINGEEEANKFSARPGQSEHQTGLAMDVSSQSVGFGLTEKFGNTVEGKWLKDNAHNFGFIIRYLEDKTDITGYNYEPWHIRYVGKDVAEEIYNDNLTLEEYFGIE